MLPKRRCIAGARGWILWGFRKPQPPRLRSGPASLPAYEVSRVETGKGPRVRGHGSE